MTPSLDVSKTRFASLWSRLLQKCGYVASSPRRPEVCYTNYQAVLKTHGFPGSFGVALNDDHFKDLMFALVPPPAQKAAPSSGSASTQNGAEMLQMAFPIRLPESSPLTMCACHSELKSEGFLCPRCRTRVCDVPTDCDVCGIMIVSSPHLARSYHHLFPVKPYRPV